MIDILTYTAIISLILSLFLAWISAVAQDKGRGDFCVNIGNMLALFFLSLFMVMCLSLVIVTGN